VTISFSSRTLLHVLCHVQQSESKFKTQNSLKMRQISSEVSWINIMNTYSDILSVSIPKQI
jgi:hypothetical protein